MNTKVSVWRMGLVSVAALSLAACGGGETAPAATDAAGTGEAGALDAGMAGTGADMAAPGAAPAAAAAGQLVPSPSWMPADWDQNVFGGAEYIDTQPAEDLLRWRQTMIFTVPITLWAIANDTLVDERFEPIWVWYTALRSCEKGIQMTEDLAGEFGDRERGKAALTTARNELKAWAATQPKEITLYFTAELGQWNERTGNFPLRNFSDATTIPTKQALQFDQYFEGANVEAAPDADGVTRINHFQASLLAPECLSKDKTKIYKFEKLSQWWVIPGDVERGAGGLVNYKERAAMPLLTMTREQAAAYAQRNPERKVEVSVTLAPMGESIVKGTDQSAIRTKIVRGSITDFNDGTVLVNQTY
jgi:hypothetical protein